MKFAAALTFVAIAGMVLAPLAVAQDEHPGAPLRLVPPPPVPDRDAVPTPPPAPQTPAGIGTIDLGPLDPSWADALPKGEAALPPDMWQGTSRGIVRGLLPLVGPNDSPAARALARRLLLSGAAAPPGADPADAPSLVLLRAEALTRLGAFAGARTVLGNFPADKRGEAAARLRIELDFAGNDITGGCGRVAAGIAQNRNVWWDQANVACLLLSGERDKAALALDIMHDNSAAPDPVFDTLVAGASGHAARLDKKTVLTPLRATLWAMSKRPLPAETIAAMDAATAAAYAGSLAPLPLRLAAAERAASLGAWPPEQLAALYGKMSFTDAERANAFGNDNTADTPQGRAVLFALAQNGDAAPRAHALALFLGGAARHGFYFAAARMAAPIIAALAPGDATKDTAPQFIRALIAADRAKEIAPWLTLAGGPAMPLAVAARAVDGARPDVKAAGEALAALELRSNDSTRAIGVYLMLMSDYGTEPASSELAAQIAAPSPSAMPSAALWLALQRAVAGHRRGETILAALAVAQEGGRLNTEPIVAQRVLSALRDAGLDADARSLARDEAVASGL
ncbi:MAG TPA: hypothetical protein VID77_05875 [Stellaceae bacterium]|jgi:hypothetical protein